MKSPERRHRRRPGVFIVKFEQISHNGTVISIDGFKQVNPSWEIAD